MNTTSSAISLMTERYQKLKEKKQGETPHTSIEVPEEILRLVDNKAYINRYKRLIREGYLRQLLELARIAHECATKQPPSHYFAKACSLTHWDDTLKRMNKVLEAARTVTEVLSRLPSLPKKIALAAFWKKGTAIVLDAITASEIGRKDKAKFFEWLVWSPNRKYGSV